MRVLPARHSSRIALAAVAGLIALLLVVWTLTAAHHHSGNASAASSASAAPEDSGSALPSQEQASPRKDSAEENAGYALASEQQKSGQDAGTAQDTSARKALDSGSAQGKALTQGLSALDAAGSDAKPAAAATQRPGSDRPEDRYTDQAKALQSADLSSLQEHFDGDALQDQANRLIQLQTNGWHTEGRTKVSGTPQSTETIVDGKKALHVTVCTDPSEVKVVDAHGKTVQEPSHQKVRMLYTLSQRGDQWKIIDQGFPEDPTC